MTADILFVNVILIFISISFKIIFTAVNHLPYSKSNTIFKAFNEIYMYYIKRGFLITIPRVDIEFVPLQALIHNMPGVP